MAAESIRTKEILISKKNKVVVKTKISIPRLDIESSSRYGLQQGTVDLLRKGVCVFCGAYLTNQTPSAIQIATRGSL